MEPRLPDQSPDTLLAMQAFLAHVRIRATHAVISYLFGAQAGRQRYDEGRYSEAELLLCAAMACLLDGWETRAREAHLAFDVLLHRFACAVRLGSQVPCHHQDARNVRQRSPPQQVVAANLRPRLLQLHQHLHDAAASQHMVHTLLDLAEAVEQPPARVLLLRMALAANRRDLGDAQNDAMDAAEGYLDEGMASTVRIAV